MAVPQRLHTAKLDGHTSEAEAAVWILIVILFGLTGLAVLELLDKV